jgi:acetyl esterase/lipase
VVILSVQYGRLPHLKSPGIELLNSILNLTGRRTGSANKKLAFQLLCFLASVREYCFFQPLLRSDLNRPVICGVALLLILSGSGVQAFESNVVEIISLWPDGATGSKYVSGVECDTTETNSELVAGQRVIRLGNVSVPTISLYRPSQDKANGIAVIVCPGGGYSILAMDLEGLEVCQWLNSIGVTAVLLKYRVPTRPNDDQHILPLQDVQRALGLVRFHAKEWHLNINQIGVLGFSAGGHLAAHLNSNFNKRVYKCSDAADQASCRPDFSMLIYPAYLVRSPLSNRRIAPELKITTNMPPAFLIQAEDDGIGVENSLIYYLALKEAGVPIEMHLYPKGGHGYGLRPSKQMVSSWPLRAEAWLQELFPKTKISQ